MLQSEQDRTKANGDRTGARARARGGAWVVLAALAVALSATPSAADPYDDKSAGNPVRIAAYVLHPVGVILDYLILRPAHWLVMKEPMKTLFGHTDD